MDTNKVLEQANYLFNSIEEIDKRMDIWNSDIQGRILRTLQGLAGQINDDKGHRYSLQVFHKNILGSLNSVLLNISQNTSQIVLLKESNEDLKIAGGKLIFGQTFNGKVAVIIHYPFITNFRESGQQMILDKLEPDDLTESRIYEFSYRFMVEMNRWFNDDFEQERTVGFQLSSAEEDDD